MSVSYDLGTSTGQVRLLVPDRSLTAPVFQDEEIAAFVLLEGDVRRAAALALETVAADLAATLRVTKALGYSVDGVQASAQLLKRAASLRAQAETEDAEAGGLLDWAEFALAPFGTAERLDAERMRSDG